MIFPGVLSNT